MHLSNPEKSFTFHSYSILFQQMQHNCYFRQADSLPRCFICLFLSPSIYFVLPLCQLKEGNVVVFSYLSSLHCGTLFCSVCACLTREAGEEQHKDTSIVTCKRDYEEHKRGRDTHANAHYTLRIFGLFSNGEPQLNSARSV